MKNKIIFLFLILSSCLYGQGNKFTVSGVVTDCQTKLSLINFPVKIVCSDGKVVETKTDVNGKYIIELQFEKLPLSCVVVFYTAENPISCIYTGEKTKFTIEDSSINSKTEDMCLVNMGKLEEKVFPDILFKKNSRVPISSKEQEKIKEMVKIMKDNPTFLIGIDANTETNEQENDSLWVKRSEYVKTKMIELGIEADRLINTNHSNCSTNPSKEQLSKVQNEQEKDILFQNSRHVSFTVLRKDYVSKSAIRIK